MPPGQVPAPGATALARDGLLRITLSFLRFAVILGVLPAGPLRPGPRTPARLRESWPVAT